MPLACVARELALSLLRDAKRVLTELRLTVLSLAHANCWRAQKEAELTGTNHLTGVLAALLPLEFPAGQNKCGAAVMLTGAVMGPKPQSFDNDVPVTRQSLARRKRRLSLVSSQTSKNISSTRRKRRRVLDKATTVVKCARLQRVGLFLSSLASGAGRIAERLVRME